MSALAREALTPKHEYCCVNAERGIWPCTQECLDDTLQFNLRWLARHTCRGSRDTCNACGPTIRAVQILRQLGARTSEEERS